MPPILAFFLTTGAVLYFFRRDFREKPNLTRASWLPLIWLLIIETRSFCQWLDTFGVPVVGSLDEGTPLDAFVYLVLILAGIYVLRKRQITLKEVARYNRWIAVYLTYCFIAISWSDFPFVAFKHWIKVIGHPIMVMILLTEPDPKEAVMRLFKRSAYVFVLYSIMAIKYFEAIGQSYDPWTGAQANNGISLDKNTLGCGCMILGCFFIWNLVRILPQAKQRALRGELMLTLLFLYLVGWLFWKAHSATSLITLILCTGMIIFTSLPFINRRAIGLYLIAAAILLAIAQVTFDIFGQITALSGHEETFNGRGHLWTELLNFNINPVLGTGFESFWLGDRIKQLWAEHWWHPNEAHNGYLETYLNLGIAGLVILAGLLIAAIRRAIQAVANGQDFGRFRLGFLVGVLIYNWTESGFRGLDPVWFVFFIVAMEYPAPEPEPVAPIVEVDTESGAAEVLAADVEVVGFAGRQ